MNVHEKKVVRRVSSVEPQKIDRWRVGVPAGRSVTVILQSREHGDIAFEVLDASTGEAISRAQAGSHFKMARLRGSRSGSLDIRIANQNERPTAYELFVRS